MALSFDFDVIHAVELVVVITFSAGMYVATTNAMKKQVTKFGEILDRFDDKLDKLVLEQSGQTGRTNLLDERVTAQGKRVDDSFVLFRREITELSRRFNAIIDTAVMRRRMQSEDQSDA